MSSTFFKRIRWAAISVVAAVVSGFLALSRPASSPLPPSVTLGGAIADRVATDPAVTNPGLVVISPPIVVFNSADLLSDEGIGSVDSPFDDDGPDGVSLEDTGSSDTLDETEVDEESSTDSPDGGD